MFQKKVRRGKLLEEKGEKRQEKTRGAGRGRVEGTEEVRRWKEMKGRLGWGKVRGELRETEAETGESGGECLPRCAS